MNCNPNVFFVVTVFVATVTRRSGIAGDFRCVATAPPSGKLPIILLLAAVMQLCLSSSGAAQDTNWYEKKTDWHGNGQLHFQIADRSAYIVVPKKPIEGKPWIWRARFPGYHAEMDIELVKRGFHIGYVDVGGMFGSPKAMRIGDQFYEFMTTERGLSRKPVLEGVSRGGLFVYNWAARNPKKVTAIYCDTPVCDIKSWPGGKGKGVGAAKEWKQCLEVYGVEEKLAASVVDPVDIAPSCNIAQAKIPILHIVSENDRIVPPNENTYLLKKRMEEHGHGMQVISVATGTEKSSGHHFTHPEPDRVVEFVIASLAKPSEPISKADATERMSMLKAASRVVFLGDSITMQGKYVTYFDTWLTKQNLKRPPMVINVGLSSETVSGLSEDGHAGGRFPRPDLAERLERVLDLTKPDLVFACYGINCGIYQPFSEERFAAYKKGILHLKTRVEAAGAKLVLVTPPTFDDQRAKKGFSYNGVLDKYTEWLVGQRKEGWTVIDLHTPMSEELAARRKANPEFTFQPDSVHPNDDGHLFIAQGLIKWFGGDPADASDRTLTHLVGQRMQVLRDSYLFTAGHKRPGVKRGLPPAWAKSKAAQVTEQINRILQELKQRDASIYRAQGQFASQQTEDASEPCATFDQSVFVRRYVRLAGKKRDLQKIRYRIESTFEIYPPADDSTFKATQTIASAKLVTASSKAYASIVSSLQELEGRTFTYRLSESGDILSLATEPTEAIESDRLLVSRVLQDNDWRQVTRLTLFQPPAAGQPFFQKVTRDFGRFGSWFGESRFAGGGSRGNYEYFHSLRFLPPWKNKQTNFEVGKGVGGAIKYDVNNQHVVWARELFRASGEFALPEGGSVRVADKQIFTINVSNYQTSAAE